MAAGSVEQTHKVINIDANVDRRLRRQWVVGVDNAGENAGSFGVECGC